MTKESSMMLRLVAKHGARTQAESQGMWPFSGDAEFTTSSATTPLGMA